MNDTIIPFPRRACDATEEPRWILQSTIDQLHSKAFRDMEGDIEDLNLVAEIAADYAHRCSQDPTSRNCDLMTFTTEMLRYRVSMFLTHYHNRWHDEPLSQRPSDNPAAFP